MRPALVLGSSSASPRSARSKQSTLLACVHAFACICMDKRVGHNTCHISLPHAPLCVHLLPVPYGFLSVACQSRSSQALFDVMLMLVVDPHPAGCLAPQATKELVVLCRLELMLILVS